VESKERGEGSREKETRGETEEASGRGKMTKKGSGEIDEGRGETLETKRSGRHLLSGSGLTDGGCIGAVKKLVEENESGTSGVSSVRGGNEFD